MTPFLWFFLRRPPEDCFLPEFHLLIPSKKAPGSTIPEKSIVLPGTKHRSKSWCPRYHPGSHTTDPPHLQPALRIL